MVLAAAVAQTAVAIPTSAAFEREAADAASPPSEKWDFEKGAELVRGRFVVRLLGGGERYESLLAWDERLFSLVVVKILRPHLLQDRHALEGLVSEIRMLESLKHPVLVRALDAVQDGPRPHIVLEHLEGPRLSTLIRKYGPIEREQLLPLGLQLFSVLHYLTGEGIVHLDVKPSNIIMGAPARLIDLSIAQPLTALVGKRSPIGTDAYMAPEQCDPALRGPITAAADVWGVGATLYDASSGRRPFERPERDHPRFPQLEVAPAPLPANLPQELLELVMACLDPEPGARPTPAEAAGELELLVNALPQRLVLGRFRVRSR